MLLGQYKCRINPPKAVTGSVHPPCAYLMSIFKLVLAITHGLSVSFCFTAELSMPWFARDTAQAHTEEDATWHHVMVEY